ncbi:CBS domain-containing protein [Corynebacterium poyangense]|uniref:CBS domain-containing protein n=1 Tax=Corynebacterium poyangense TaxID=2684405 RepID=A0A7H0SN81_9CORY|nr:CBS domain-containing protein [Corynebacterium poyangense]MBZ8177028.1 CBS domain-containing protein [Corynebacterium poyangense]QNQ90006.1 CBS domain-containing protein [Corynebacterium poyangense]
MSLINRVYAGRLRGMVIHTPDGEPFGRVRDVVSGLRPQGHVSRALGLVVELNTKRRIFLPMLRIASIEPGDITLTTGSVSLRTFVPRAGEATILGDIIGTKVHTDDPDSPDLHDRPLEIADVELERTRSRDWIISRVAVFSERPKFGRTPSLSTIPFQHIHGIAPEIHDVSNATVEMIAGFDDLRPADVANILSDLPKQTREQVARELNDQRLADILQELPEDEQTALLESLGIERAADVLEEMDPDDAADLLAELPEPRAEVLLGLMDPEESAPVRRLMSFSPDTVGALMTTEPLILTPQTTVAEALALARDPDLPTSLSSMVFVVRPPTATPTGRYLGCVHLQRLLREPPASLVAGVLDPDLPPLYATDSQETAARYFATYNLVCGPVLDEDKHLLGAVAIDDLLDHLLPEGWREDDWRLEPEPGATTLESVSTTPTAEA